MDSKPNALTPLQVYKYCPKCAGKLACKGGNLLQCTSCEYDFFINPIPAAGIIILNDKNEVLLTKRKFDPHKEKWQSPGGFMKLGETYDEALEREVYEEIGVKVRLGEFLGTTPEVYPYQGVMLPTLVLYRAATIIEGTILAKDDVSEARFFKISELSDLNMAYASLLPIINKCINLT